MPSKQRQRVKRRTFAKLRIKRKRESSELIDTIRGSSNSIIPEDDIEDDRILKLLQQKQSTNGGQRDIFLTDLLDIDSDENDANDDQQHTQMLEDIFSSQAVKQPTIMGSQLDADPLDIQTNATDLQYLMRRDRKHKKKDVGMNLSQRLDQLDDEILQNERVSMNEMISALNVPFAKSAHKQIHQFDENQELQRLKLAAQSKVNTLNVARKERGLQMDKTTKEMQAWSQAVTAKREQLKHRRNMIPPTNNMLSFMENMEWNGDLGKELQCVLDDYTTENDLDSALKPHKPSKIEVIKQARKMASMRRQIANQIKEFKRIKKIKSKKFRKRMRSRKAKMRPNLDELQELDPRLYRREVKKLVRQRAEERMTLRHKNSSKWAVNIMRRGKDGKIDLNSRRALMEQLERGQELKRKIKGLDSDDDEVINPKKPEKSHKNKAFETEAESAKKQKDKYISDAQTKGIWNMKFMKTAEDKRRADIRALTDTAVQAKSFSELDDLERSVDKIEAAAYRIHPLVNRQDDPIRARGLAKYLAKEKKAKQDQVAMAQTILGKRKFGAAMAENTRNAKRMKRMILDVGDKSKIVGGTQGIEESVFGVGSKSVIRVDVENEEAVDGKLVCNETMREKEISEPVFEMVAFPKHNDKKMVISEVNRLASKRPDYSELSDRFRFGERAKVHTQRYYVDRTSVGGNDGDGGDGGEEGEGGDGDGWSVFLKGNESVHSVRFGTLAMERQPVETEKNRVGSDGDMDIDIGAFLGELDVENEDEKINEKNAIESDGDMDIDAFLDESEVENESEIKSILKQSKYESIGSGEKRVKFGENKYFDDQKRNANGNNIENNPWLSQLNNKQRKPLNPNSEQNGQRQTTQFDAKKMLIPPKSRKSPDFNLLQTKDPKQIDIIYNSLKKNQLKSEFIPNDTAIQEFKQLKDAMIEQSMPNAIGEPLKGWDHWTGPGINDDMAYRDDEYIQAKALWLNKKKELMEKRRDGQLPNVILSDQISKASSKYLMKYQPDWVNLGMYREKMKDTLGREWNLATEFFNSIAPEHDIPSGYIIRPTQIEDGNDESLSHKTRFGKKGNNRNKGNLHSVYKRNVASYKRPKYGDSRPSRGKV